MRISLEQSAAATADANPTATFSRCCGGAGSAADPKTFPLSELRKEQLLEPLINCEDVLLDLHRDRDFVRIDSAERSEPDSDFEYDFYSDSNSSGKTEC